MPEDHAEVVDNTDEKRGSDVVHDQSANDDAIGADDYDKSADDAAMDDVAAEAADDAGAEAAGGVDDKLEHYAREDGEHAIVKCTTTAGPFTIHLHREWSPQGYDRAAELFERGFYDGSHFYRVVPHFLVQFGISYTTDADLKTLASSTFPDDPKHINPLLPFREGMVSFAGSGLNSRSSQLFVAYDKAMGLGTSPWETPVGEVVEGMESAVRNIYTEYGDMPPWGKGPQQGPIHSRGAKYIEEEFPMLDKFLKCKVMRADSLVRGHHSGDGDNSKQVVSTATRSREKTTGVVETIGKRNIRAVINNRDDTDSASASAMPLAKLLVILAFFGAAIIGVGFLGRKKRKTGKSV